MDSSGGTTLLLVEDNPNDAQFVERLLVEHGRDVGTRDADRSVEITEIEHVERLGDGLERVTDDRIDIVLLDLGLPDSNGLETVDAMVERAPTVPVVVLTGQSGVGVEAIRRGAQDYLVKGRISVDVLVRTIQYAIERVRITHELRDRNHRLALVNEILRTDLRNDVSMIVGWGDQLRDRVSPDDQESVESILEASQHALELTDTAAKLIDVLSEGATEPEPCDLRAILETEFERCRRETDVDLTVDWAATEDEPLSVAGTPTLGAVFEQLLTNAITHTDRDRSTVEVALEATDERVTVSIADDGVGIPDAQKRRLTTVGEDAGPRAGIGAGLYFVATVLESIDAEFRVEDNRPQGTVVTVGLDRVGVYNTDRSE
ncbi:response regulator [Natrarchaeobius sp. A-rgal3]|uniref:hybrid sensor histidine kinase/response regulator n=1 Tax=Natrarchaeobius versutus TaxID=1679078 RepID=UPI00350F0C96